MSTPVLSVLIPNRNSQFTTATINDLLKNAVLEIEVIVNVDEQWPTPLVEDPRVIYIHPSSPIGMRAGINACAKIAKGQYVMKTDDHCAFGPGFDKLLVENHQDNWVQIPRRYSLDAENWKINETRPYRDYMYIDFPLKGKENNWGMHGVDWFDRQNQRTDKKYDVDETMSLQGSCWFMTRKHFVETLGYLDERIYGQFAQEAQEIGNKTWLGGGKLMTNKKTWYAHLHKGKIYGRMYRVEGFDDYRVRASNKSAYYWMENQWEGRVHDFNWLVERFWPVPSWPDNWQEVWSRQIEEGWPNKDETY